MALSAINPPFPIKKQCFFGIVMAGHGSVESREAQKLVAQALRRDKDGPKWWEMMKGNNDPYTIQVVLFFNR